MRQALELVSLVRFSTMGQEYAILGFPLASGELTDALTESERDVVMLALRGKSNSEIAAVRGTSARTVANQLASSYRKLGISSRRELIARSARQHTK